LNRLVVGDRLAEGSALGGVLERSLERGAADADGLAAMPMRPPSRVFIATLKPSPSFISRFRAGREGRRTKAARCGRRESHLIFDPGDREARAVGLDDKAVMP